MALTPKQYDALDRMRGKRELERLFLNEAKSIIWFDELKARGYFSPELNPAPVESGNEGYFQIPAWPAAEFLVSSSADIKTADNKKFATSYLEIIRNVTRHAMTHCYGNYRTWWQFCKIFKNIPNKYFELGDIELVKYWLTDRFDSGLLLDELGGWFNQLIEHGNQHANDIALELLDGIFQVEYREKKYGSEGRQEAYFPYRTHSLAELVKSICGKAGSILGLPAVTIFKNKLEDILTHQNNDGYSVIWRSAIEDHPEQNRVTEDADDIVLIGFRDALLGYCEQNIAEAEPFVYELLKSRFVTVRRIAIYMVDAHFERLQNNNVPNILVKEFFHSTYQHELWNLLHHHFSEMPVVQQEQIFSIINEISFADEDSGVNEVVTAYQKSIWLSAIAEQDDCAQKLYQQCVELAGSKPEHPDFSSYMSIGWGGHRSPISAEEMHQMNLDELINNLNGFQNQGGFDKPSLEGLAKEFKKYVKAEAEHISIELPKLISLKLAFIHEIIEGYSELWRKNESPDLPWSNIWVNLLSFLEKLLSSEEFWSQSNESNDGAFVGNRHWVVGAIGRLIEGGCQSDEHAFDVRNIEQAKRVLELILSKQPGEMFSFDSDAISIAINSPRGHCLEALINLALFSSRQTNSDNESHVRSWLQFKERFNSELSKADDGEYEFAALVANYLPNFIYLSEEWVEKNLPVIFNQSNYQRWLCAIQGYAYVSQFQPLAYAYLKDHGDFIKALDDPNLNDRVRDHFIQLIVVSYFSDRESLENESSLIYQLLVRRKFDELNQVIWFAWTQRTGKDEKLKTKIYELWPRLLVLIDPSAKEGRKLASQLCHWACFVDVLDSERKQWLLQLAPYAEENFNSHDLLKSLALLSKDYPLDAQEVWLAMLSNYSYDYPEDAIQEIFTQLVRVGRDGEKRAKQIADAYLKHGLTRPMDWLNNILGNAHK